MGDTGKPTGWYLVSDIHIPTSSETAILIQDPQPEFAHPYDVLAPVSDITIASPSGGLSPLDPSSVEASKADKASVNFLETKKSLWENTVPLSSLVGKSAEYDAIFYVGGHGPMFDLAQDSTSHKLINEFYEAGKVVAAVCHGPAAFAYVKTKSGKYLLDGQAVTGFSNSEEDAVGLSSAMPFMLETQLQAASGGKFEKAADWAANVVVSDGGKIITGQNPASATGVGEAIKKQLKL